ncbi:uncharacterized protein LOC118265220 [Spodoptera frugiperda]|uniref:Uncharacterized protein LOC118265220 n=1 Tax=Spodoptera frugiperda TaxID=7108 RepID=A0A9R0F334_SPOFR|nr:uncharacterized protein LOC118265220 [Spodoptera frugiperda]
MKIYILLCVVALTFIPATLAHAGAPVNIVITVLYYCDENGDKVLVAGKVDKEIQRIILDYLHTDKPVKIVPVYEDISEVPPVEVLDEKIQEKHKNIFMTFVPTKKIREIAEEKERLFRPEFLAELRQKRVNSFATGLRNLIEEAAEYKLNDVVEWNKRFQIGKFSSLILQSSIPNAVYFSISRT